MFNYMRDRGADIHSTWDGKDLLMFAAELGLIDIMKYLINEGLDVNRRGPELLTPLHYATMSV